MIATDTASLTEIVPYAKWLPQIEILRGQFSQADPYPHLVLDHFLATEALEKALEDFPSPRSKNWIHYQHVNERKFGKNKREDLPASINTIMDALNSDRFLGFLETLTGIANLIADPNLEGGGIHQIPPGGFLNIHADFFSHPHHRNWRRRINLLIYLNKDWHEAFGGHLELWDKKMTSCVKKVLPVFNRAVIFRTDRDSYHGHPNPLTCPRGNSRKSIALYYFTQEKERLPAGSTNYRARPEDGLKKIWIQLDKMVLHTYDRLKRKFNANDGFANRILKKVHEFRKQRDVITRGKNIRQTRKSALSTTAKNNSKKGETR